MADIKPLDLPTAAGVSFGEGDVRHFSEGDAMDVPSLQNPTRELAERDNLLAEKLNEVVSAVNNKEQFVPFPLLHTNIPPATEEIITNFRIPPGFEARVLNAVVGTTPASSNIQINIYFASGFGNTTGTNIVSSTTEFTGGGQFFNNGEFIVTLKNTGSTSLDCAASITLTVRPIGSKASLLVGSIIQGQQGSPGQTGPKGDKGDAGIGGTGSPGLVWKDAWLNGATYNAPTDVVSFPLFGTLTSSYVALQTHVASPANEPPNATFWSPVAVGSSGSTTTTINVNNTSSGSIPNYFSHFLQGTIVTGADWIGSAVTGYNGAVYSAGSMAFFAMSEAFIESASNNPGFNRGMGFLGSVLRVAFQGHGTLTLPKVAGGARVNYTSNYVTANATVHGTVPTNGFNATGSIVPLVTMIPTSTDSFVFNNMNVAPLWVEIVIQGVQAY